MRSHRSIWGFAILMVLAAIALSSLQGTSKRVHEVKVDQDREADLQAELIGEMLDALEGDPRVRRASTRVLVEKAAALLTPGVAPRAEVQYAGGLLRFYGEYDLEGAEAAFRRALEIDPDWAWPHNALAIVLFTAGQEKEAEAEWGRALALAPGWVRPYNDRAILYRRADRFDDAKDQLALALAMAPEDAVTHYNYGVFLDLTDDHEGARLEYETALELDAEMPAAHYNLACSYAREGRIEKAAGYLEEAIRLNLAFRGEAKTDPDFDSVRDEVPYLRIVER